MQTCWLRGCPFSTGLREITEHSSLNSLQLRRFGVLEEPSSFIWPQCGGFGEIAEHSSLNSPQPGRFGELEEPSSVIWLQCGGFGEITEHSSLNSPQLRRFGELEEPSSLISPFHHSAAVFSISPTWLHFLQPKGGFFNYAAG
jgi:hypothetical protein